MHKQSYNEEKSPKSELKNILQNVLFKNVTLQKTKTEELFVSKERLAN